MIEGVGERGVLLTIPVRDILQAGVRKERTGNAATGIFVAAFASAVMAYLIGVWPFR